MENREKTRRPSAEGQRGSTRSSLLAPRSSRNGVLLLVVLSMLVLFMLIGTAFLMTSSQSRDAAKGSAKFNRLGSHATRILDSALFQVVRDTENPYSVVRYHSLLRDLYGTDGFQGAIYVPADATKEPQYLTRFAGAITGNAAAQLGPTQAQFIDLYVVALGYKAGDSLDLRHVLKLDRNVLGQPLPYTLPLTKGYFNGCLLTITSGPASGQSTRILDYEYIADLPPLPPPSGTTTTRLFRLRVLTFPKKDGQPLQIGSAPRAPEIGDLAGATFLVNGRAFSGTGVGYNPLASIGQPRLSALQLFYTDPAKTQAIGAELALLPNSVYFNPLNNLVASATLSGDPFVTPALLKTFAKLNDPTASLFYYGSFPGPGGTNEGYDAADYQNVGLALQTVTPRSQGRVVTKNGTYSIEEFVANPGNLSDFWRFDLEDLPVPSFHRPDLANFWYHRLLTYLTKYKGMNKDDAVRAILRPYQDDKWTLNANVNSLTTADAALISAIKRQFMLRPTIEDHPHFDGSNPLSVAPVAPFGNGAATDLAIPTVTTPFQITYPYWEAVGPWDVDNDNDGVRDSVWLDVGNPVIEAEDGTRYKALVSYLIVDLDSRLNVNAHGLVDEILPPRGDPTRNSSFDLTYDPNNLGNWAGNLAHNPASGTLVSGVLGSTLQLPRGLGYGPAEISLRPVFPAPLNVSLNPLYGNRAESNGPVDSYFSVLTGRLNADGKAIEGRYGFDTNISLNVASQATAGTNYQFDTKGLNKEPPTSLRWYTGEMATPDLQAMLKFFDYPWSFVDSVNRLRTPSAFGNPPDLKGRYATGLDYWGQPVYEVANDVNPNTALLPAAKRLPFNLLAKTPYELDLSSPRRRDITGVTFPDAGTAFSSTIDKTYGGGPAGLNDDAPFSPTDLEKVLRAWDADAGTLPSRLWDVANDFDPAKLVIYDPYRVQAKASSEFGSTSQSALLAAAQQIAGINRRLVTTEQYSLPVANQTMPSYVSEFGADGAVGRRGQANQLLNQAGTDDFQFITGVNRAQAKITDLLYYRDWLEARKFVMRTQTLTEADLDALSPADYLTFLKLVKDRTDYVFPRLGDLLAPEVLAGQRMDLNRPFGDGKDNNDNGVVDDPLEAGEPFLDIDGNGSMTYDNNQKPLEPFLDLNGDKIYQGPGDRLWSQLGPVAAGGDGTLQEPIQFDYTNGHAEPIHAAVVAALNKPVLGGVRNLESQARQLYARHLYCLMLLLVDENYIAPWDENDPQMMTFMDTERKKLTAANPAMTPPEADLIVKRKLTCRMIAQWAVNCVDMRDADAIMTPFEYDENPWDGWGVWDDKWIGENSNASFIKKSGDPFNPTTGAKFIPLDGDPATNENDGWVIDWSADLPPNGGPKTLKQLLVNPSLPVGVTNPALITHPLDQTRGVVWGAERPELLITETLGLHDRRTEDLPGANKGQHDEKDGTSNERYPDTDMDQRLRPRGSLFIELFNPWSPDGQHPIELYTRLDGTTNYQAQSTPGAEGVDLSRLSTWGVREFFDPITKKAIPDKAMLTTDASTGVIKRSPVWRVIVADDWPKARNKDRAQIGNYKVGDLPPDVKTASANLPAGYQTMISNIEGWDITKPLPYHAPDPDFDAMFNSGFVPTQVVGQRNQFNIEYPYIEREFYFTTDDSPTVTVQIGKGWGERVSATDPPKGWDYSQDVFKLRIPERYIKLTGVTYGPTDPGNVHWARSQKFIPIALETQKAANKSVIAPIMPGRYGVIGSASTQYDTLPNCFTTTIGREDTNTKNTSDTNHRNYVKRTRRIELVPNPNPNLPQVIVASNGGDPKDKGKTGISPTPDPATLEMGRDNELINNTKNGTVENITDQDNDSLPDPVTLKPSSGIADKGFYHCSVGIPVEGMSISEPPWGWGPREEEAADEEFVVAKSNQRPGWPPATRTVYPFNPLGAVGEGVYSNPAAPNNTFSYDKPFDKAPELIRTGTTANYRTVHLQRLANPLLPWNPPPGQFKDSSGTDLHRPNLPINPYRTVDSSTVNLTAFNGPSERDAEPIDQAQKLRKSRPWVPSASQEIQHYLDHVKDGSQAWYLRSTERGAWSRLNVAGQAANPKTSPPQRVLWAQEPAMVEFRTATGSQLIFDLLPGRNMTMRADEVPDADSNPDFAALNISPNNHVNMVLEHSLGFGNESFADLYDAQGAQSPMPPTLNAVGAPRSGKFVWDNNFSVDVDSTNPWLAWDNRPYVGAEELLKVPAASQAQMLRQYATIDPNAAIRLNPYGLATIQASTPSLGSKQVPVVNAVRWAVMQAPFGHLANVFAATAESPIDPSTKIPLPIYFPGVAGVIRDNDLPTASLPAGYVVRGVPVRFKGGAPVLPDTNPTADGDVLPYGGPNFSRILEYVQVPSRFIGTDTMLNAETFNDVPPSTLYPNEPIGTDITSSTDPRYYFQPPFNKVSRERDPGRVNLNTVTGRRIIENGVPHIWSEVYDGIMHRIHDANNPATNELGHFGPAWRDVALSRRGYLQVDAAGTYVDKPLDVNGQPSVVAPPDTMQFGLNNSFPTFFANPFRSPDAGDLVPLAQMMQFGVDASMERVHPRTRGLIPDTTILDPIWGGPSWPAGYTPFNDARDAGFNSDGVSFRGDGAIPNSDPTQREILPLFSDVRVQPNFKLDRSDVVPEPFTDPNRNPYMMYEPMSRLGNLVTNRSGCYAVWITVGYFEVEKAPDWNDPDPTLQANIRAHFGGDINLYNRAYPDGYMLGKEVGSETGDVKRPRGFYIIDRTEEVGFKPGEDLNVEKTIRLRRRIE